MRVSVLVADITKWMEVAADTKEDHNDKTIIADLKKKFPTADDIDLTSEELLIVFKATEKGSPSLKEHFKKIKQEVVNTFLNGNFLLLDRVDEFFALSGSQQKTIISLADYLNVIVVLPNKPLAPLFLLIKPFIFSNPIAIRDALKILHDEIIISNTPTQKNLLTAQNIKLIIKKPADADFIAKAICILNEKEILETSRDKLEQVNQIDLLATSICQLSKVINNEILTELMTAVDQPDCTPSSIYYITLKIRNKHLKDMGGSGGGFKGLDDKGQSPKDRSKYLLAAFSIHSGIAPDPTTGTNVGTQNSSQEPVLLLHDSEPKAKCPSFGSCSIS